MFLINYGYVIDLKYDQPDLTFRIQGETIEEHGRAPCPPQKELSMKSIQLRYVSLAVSLVAALVLSGCGKKQSVDIVFSDYTASRAIPGAASGTMVAMKQASPAK